MTQVYAADVMGNAGLLPHDVITNLIPALRKHPTTIIFLAYFENKVVGIATCFLGFSTFTARQLINIHDLAVRPEYKGQGIGRSLLQAVESKARSLGCSRLTLEVQEHNSRARNVYAAAGFEGAQGGSLFCTKHL